MMLISIIMPVYNTGEILQHTIEQIRHQTYEKWELLLVDDGSTDNSNIICRKYAEIDPRISYYRKSNGGICDARNYGIERAKGEYIAFCDHDDDYLPDLLEKITYVIRKDPTDLIKYRYNIFHDDRKSSLPIWKEDVYVEHNIRSIALELLSNNYLNTVWSFVYKRSLLLDSGFFFDRQFIHGHEDIDFNLRILPFVKKITFIPDILYTHYIRGCLSTSAKTYDDILLLFLSQIDVVNRYIKDEVFVLTDNEIYYNHYFYDGMSSFFAYAAKMDKSWEFVSKQIITYKRKRLTKFLYRDFKFEYKKSKRIFLWMFVDYFHISRIAYDSYRIIIKFPQINRMLSVLKK